MGDIAETVGTRKVVVGIAKLKELGITALEQTKNVFRVDTEYGAVMYYPPSNKWQHRGKVHRGDVLSFKSWLTCQGYIQ